MHRNFPMFRSSNPRSGEYHPEGRVLTFMPNKRGNPNWGRPMQPSSILFTEFEMQARHLHLTPDQYVASAELRSWCEKNRNHSYIPEWLLDEWELRVNDDLTGGA